MAQERLPKENETDGVKMSSTVIKVELQEGMRIAIKAIQLHERVSGKFIARTCGYRT